MQYSTLLLTTLATLGATFPLFPRAPANWTMKSFTRTCPSTDSCSFTYGIFDGSTTTNCAYTVNATNAATASYGPETCGGFVITSGWSGQFGPGNGFTVLAVKGEGEIIYPGYTDNQLVSGVTVTPDQTYTPQASS
ncbi:hypothetical protein MMC13_002157 [Lambiella insularis]|nr:hypothetical protein [Lambiella insularis]